MIEKENQSADFTGFSLVSGGFFYKLTSFLRNDKKGNGLKRTAIALVLITWLVMCVLSLLSGTLDDDSTTIYFFICSFVIFLNTN